MNVSLRCQLRKIQQQEPTASGETAETETEAGGTGTQKNLPAQQDCLGEASLSKGSAGQADGHGEGLQRDTRLSTVLGSLSLCVSGLLQREVSAFGR